MNFVKEIKDLRGKIVLLRLDLNVPIKDGKITDETRINKTLPIFKYLIEKNCRIVVLSHVGRPKGKKVFDLSLKPICKNLEKKINKKIELITENIFNLDKDKLFLNHNCEIVFLENISYLFLFG